MKKLMVILLLYIFSCSCSSKGTIPRRMYITDSMVVRADTSGLKITATDSIRWGKSRTIITVLRPPRYRELNLWQALIMTAIFIVAYLLKK